MTTPPSEQKSKARERYEKRKQRTQTMATVSAESRPKRRQVAPARDHQAGPSLGTIPYLRPLLIGGAAVVFMLLLIVGVGLFKNDPPAVAPNALWIGREWTYRVHDDDDVVALADRLRENRVGTVYAHISELNFDGTWTGQPDGNNRFDEVQPQVLTFAEQFKRLSPDIQILGTVYFRVDIGEEDGYRLNTPAIQTLVAEFCGRVVNTMGYDGVLLVVEPVWNDNRNDFRDFLRLVRDAIGDEHVLAVAVPPDWTPEDANVPQTNLIAAGTVWQTDFKQLIAVLGADQIVVQAYNSYLTTEADYIAWTAYQAQTYAEAIGDLGVDTQVLISVPTYGSFLPAHDERIENIEAALTGVQQGLERAGEFAPIVPGVAIYGEWDTDEIEWEQFRAQWIRN